jgi:hypothetical protein
VPCCCALWHVLQCCLPLACRLAVRNPPAAGPPCCSAVAGLLPVLVAAAASSALLQCTPPAYGQGRRQGGELPSWAVGRSSGGRRAAACRRPLGLGGRGRDASPRVVRRDGDGGGVVARQKEAGWGCCLLGCWAAGLRKITYA